MIKSTNHLAFPSLLIKCAGLLAPNQLERLQEQQGQGQTGGLFLFGFFLCLVGFYNTSSISRLSFSYELRQKERYFPVCYPWLRSDLFFLLGVRKLIATFDKWELWIFCCDTDAGVCTLLEPGCCAILPWVIVVLEPCLHEQVARSSEVIAKYILTILLGKVSRILDYVYFLPMYRYAVWFESDLFHILM